MAKIIKSAKGSFTAASITVDGSGRVVTASSGAGSANMKYHYFSSGSASGNITAGANVSKLKRSFGPAAAVAAAVTVTPTKKVVMEVLAHLVIMKRQ